MRCADLTCVYFTTNSCFTERQCIIPSNESWRGTLPLSDYFFYMLAFVWQFKIGGRANVSILESDMFKNLVKGGILGLK